jgi:hypothetical protein
MCTCLVMIPGNRKTATSPGCRDCQRRRRTGGSSGATTGRMIRRQTRFLQQIQGGQQMEFIENEIDSGHHSGQPRVSFAESTSAQYHHLLASLNLLETQTMQAVASETHQEAADSFSSCDIDTRSGRSIIEPGVPRVSPSTGHRRPVPGVKLRDDPARHRCRRYVRAPALTRQINRAKLR